MAVGCRGYGLLDKFILRSKLLRPTKADEWPAIVTLHSAQVQLTPRPIV